MAAMLRDLVHRRRRRWAHAPVIHAASHFYHKKRVGWVSISMHACGPVPIIIGLCLAALRAVGAPLFGISNYRFPVIYKNRRKCPPTEVRTQAGGGGRGV